MSRFSNAALLVLGGALFAVISSPSYKQPLSAETLAPSFSEDRTYLPFGSNATIYNWVSVAGKSKGGGIADASDWQWAKTRADQIPYRGQTQRAETDEAHNLCFLIRSYSADSRKIEEEKQAVVQGCSIEPKSQILHHQTTTGLGYGRPLPISNTSRTIDGSLTKLPINIRNKTKWEFHGKGHGGYTVCSAICFDFD